MDLIEKLRTAIVNHELFEPDEPVVVGVSGGPDSVVLLHSLLQIARDMGIRLHIGHLNHLLRGAESEEEAAFVSSLAAEWGVPATVDARPVREFSKQHHLSLEEAARLVRYRFLAEVATGMGSRTIAVAHNADDQVETVLMHFLRGAGLAGLRGMSYRSELPLTDSQLTGSAHTLAADIKLVRPLLDVTRAEIEAYAHEQKLEYRNDLSNRDTTILRNRLRYEVIPYLENLNPNLRQVLRNSAASLGDDYELLHTEMGQIFPLVARRVDGAFVFDRERWRALPPSLQRSTLREAVSRLRRGLRNLDWRHVEDARQVALTKQAGAEATLPQGLFVVVGYAEFTVGHAYPEPDVPLLHEDEIPLRYGTIDLPESLWQVTVEALELKGEPTRPDSLKIRQLQSERLDDRTERLDHNRWEAVVDADQVKGDLLLRRRKPGERFLPSGLGGRHKSVHNFMIDEKIPRQIRDRWPILSDGEKILWVCGYRIDERAKPGSESRRAIRVEFSRIQG